MISLQRCVGEEGGGSRGGEGEARSGRLGAGSHVGQDTASGTYQSAVGLLGVKALVTSVLVPVAVLVAAPVAGALLL